MYRSTIIILLLFVWIIPITWTKPAFSGISNVKKEATKVMIILTEQKLTNKTFELRYQIKNDSSEDIWICENIDLNSAIQFEVRMADDGYTLLIRRRHDVPMSGFMDQPFGRYVRLSKGRSRMESLLLTIPVCPQYIFLGPGLQKSRDAKYANRLVMEIGFYSGCLFEKVLNTTDVLTYLGGSSNFNRCNEDLWDRAEEIIIPYTHQKLKGEQVIRTTIDNLLIPYEVREVWPGPSPPDISQCTRVEIQYQPSILEYYFPSVNQQSLLSPKEIQFLQSQKTDVIDDRKYIKALSDKISSKQFTFDGSGILTEHSIANMICYRNGVRVQFITIYNDECIETVEKKRFCYHKGILRDLGISTPQVQPFKLRIKCANNLKDIGYRLRLYSKSKGELSYPKLTQWCDVIKGFSKIYRCPSAGKGKCHYAMNPNCKPNSPGNMVLLFETKDGWNQHGGPELFTFNNHDPRGGFVLLNDGTVKFIRTTEELQQLRWK